MSPADPDRSGTDLACTMTTLPLLAAWLLCGAGQAPAPSALELPVQVTWSEHIAPLVHARCVECHRPGQSAPFSLLDAATAREHAPMMAWVTAERWMPPWRPDPAWGNFAHDPRLTERELALLARWADQGAPLGDPALAPPPPTFPEGWTLGEPDLVLETAEEFVVPADGPDIYRNFVVPLPFDEDRYVTAIELRPSAPSAVHHCLYFLDETGKVRKLDEEDPGPGFARMGFARSRTLGGWAVGARAEHLPFDLARELPKRSDLVLSMHFHPVGRELRERSKVGLWFAKKKPERTLMTFMVPPDWGYRAGIDIPAGEAEFTVRDRFVLPCAVELVDVGGHAHYLGRRMHALATLPDGTTQRLFRIADWDFQWQGTYAYAEPVRLPAATAIDVEVTWDNSAENPANPSDPPVDVRWGLESTDEMGTIYFDAVCVLESDEPLFELLAQAQALRGNRRMLRPVLKQLRGIDANGDGVLAAEELPPRYLGAIDRFDLDGDGMLQLAELERVLEAIVAGKAWDTSRSAAAGGETPRDAASE